MVAKIKPTNLSPLRSAIVIPCPSLPCVELEQHQVHNALPENSFRCIYHNHRRHPEVLAVLHGEPRRMAASACGHPRDAAQARGSLRMTAVRADDGVATGRLAAARRP